MQNRNRLTDIKDKLVVMKQERGKLGVWYEQIQINMYKIDKQQEYTVQHRELYPLCSSISKKQTTQSKNGQKT